MAARRQVLFVQGAGTGTHDAWDSKVVDSLQRHLGDAFEVHYPQMPAEEDPHYATWRPAIRQALASLGGGAVVVGHSVGGAILTQTLVESPREAAPGAIVLVAAPFVGPGGWPGEEFELPRDLGGRLPRGVPVHVFHGLDDEIVPALHAELYARAIPQATLHLLPARDHQLSNDMADVARVIRRGVSSSARPGATPSTITPEERLR